MLKEAVPGYRDTASFVIYACRSEVVT